MLNLKNIFSPKNWIENDDFDSYNNLVRKAIIQNKNTILSLKTMIFNS
jgi:hypothetical protein